MSWRLQWVVCFCRVASMWVFKSIPVGIVVRRCMLMNVGVTYYRKSSRRTFNQTHIQIVWWWSYPSGETYLKMAPIQRCSWFAPLWPSISYSTPERADRGFIRLTQQDRFAQAIKAAAQHIDINQQTSIFSRSRNEITSKKAGTDWQK